jgi:hypothetical protein
MRQDTRVFKGKLTGPVYLGFYKGQCIPEWTLG